MNPRCSNAQTAARAALTEHLQFAAVVFINGQHFSFCPALLTKKLYFDTRELELLIRRIDKAIRDFLPSKDEQYVHEALCKNCGKYFAIQGRSNAEYCDRVFDEKGRICKDVGAIAL